MIDEFVVYVVVDSDGKEIERFFDEYDAKKELRYQRFYYSEKEYKVIQRKMVYSD